MARVLSGILIAVLAGPLLLIGVVSLWGATADRDWGLAATGVPAFLGGLLGLVLTVRLIFWRSRRKPRAPGSKQRHRRRSPSPPESRSGIRWLLGIPIGLLVATVVVFSSPVWILLAAFHVARTWTFRWRWSGHYFLVASRRRGWFDFVRNNVVPVLPSNTVVVWDRHERDPKQRPKVVRLTSAWGLARPYVVEVRAWRFTILPLHARLQPLKSEIGRSPSTQASVREILGEVIGRP